MPRFSEPQRQTIHQALREASKTLFAQQGLKKTSLDQLVKDAGVAKSTFYAFFESKEHLYLDLLEDEAEQMEVRVWSQVHAVGNTREALIVYMKTMSFELEQNPLTKRLLVNPTEASLLASRVTPELIARKTKRNIEPLVAYIQEKQWAGEVIQQKPELLVEVMRAAMMTVLHRQEFDVRSYQGMQLLLFEAVADKLII